jgi:uncharacterized phage protein (TIGR02216 family)
MAEPVDWPALMRLGLGALRLPPDAFWSMTPGELRRALEGAGLVPAIGRGMDRGRLAELMAAFPDGGAEARARTGATPPEGAAAAGGRPAAAVRDRGAAETPRARGGRDELR